MKETAQYYVLKEKAVPDVLLRVVEAKRLLDSGKTDSVQDATEQVGISRSSFYKYALTTRLVGSEMCIRDRWQSFTPIS